VEKILTNDQYKNKKSGTLQNMEFEMFNNLLNENILVGKDIFLTSEPVSDPYDYDKLSR
jgi:hypothetical protein